MTGASAAVAAAARVPASASHATTAVLLHGLCSTPDELMPVDSALRQAGHAVLPLRVPGYSFDASQPVQRATGHGDWLRHVSATVQRLRLQGQRVVLVGISAGATLALGSALQGPAPDGLVLMSTPLQYDGWAVPWYQFLLPLAYHTPLGRLWQYREQPPYGVKNPRVRRWIERELAARRVSCAGAAVIGVPHLREQDRLRRLLCRRLDRFACPPVLALHASDDEVASPANVTILRHRLRTPQFRAVLLPDSHHMITIDNDRLQVALETVRFVDAVAAAPAAHSAPGIASATTPIGDLFHAHVHF